MGKSDSYSFTKDGKTLWIGNLKQEPKESLRLEDISPKPSIFMGLKYISDNEFIYSTENNDKYIYNLKTKSTKKLYSIEK
ncbi:MAG TPA: hypothetical protein DD434_11275, partial [Bacteroidales bacterium]|nr:hypothetical protein [Bacteroidales bacterium]